MLASPELMEKEFWSVAETDGITDIEELNKILDRAVNLKNFLKGDERVDKIARYVAEHYVKNVEPPRYKAYLAGVDRPACAKYKAALDKYLPPEYSEVVYIGNNKDTADLKAHHIDERKEKHVRKDFANPFLVAMADRARQVQESYEDRQTSTQEALDELFPRSRRTSDGNASRPRRATIRCVTSHSRRCRRPVWPTRRR